MGQITPPPAAVWSNPDLLTVGQETMARWAVNTGAGTMVSGNLRLTFFTARKTETITQMRVWCGSTAAAATPTLIRFGLYSVAANGDIALVASTPNDTTLLAAASTAYTKALSASYVIAAGSRYAEGRLVVSAAAMPTFPAYTSSLSATELGTAPRLAAAVASQADLPASVVAASLAASGLLFYSTFLP